MVVIVYEILRTLLHVGLKPPSVYSHLTEKWVKWTCEGEKQLIATFNLSDRHCLQNIWVYKQFVVFINKNYD